MFAPFISRLGGDKNRHRHSLESPGFSFSFTAAEHIWIYNLILTWLVVGPLDGVPVVGGVQLVGDQLEGEDLLVDLDVGAGDVHLHLGVALLGCQAIANNLKNSDIRAVWRHF